MGSLPLTLFFRAARLAPPLLSIGLAAFGAPAQAEALSVKPARVGWASLYPDPQVKTLLDAFRAGLAERGFVEGKNLEIITRSGEGFRERMPAVIEELVSLKPDVIVTHAAATFSARQVKTLPVVFGFSGDPILAELTDSLARPSRNLTGISFMQVELNEKRLDLLHQIAPDAKTIVLMGDPVHPGADLEVQASEKIASQLGIAVRWRPTRNSAAVQDLLAELDRSPPDALVILPDAVMLENRERVAEFAIRRRIPAVSGWAVFAHGGGLFTYGPRLSDSFRRLAYFVTRIVEGASPSELPIEQPTIFELVVNVKTAKALGIGIPAAILARADEVIE